MAELRVLRKGRGVHQKKLDAKLGPRLKDVLGGDGGQGSSGLRDTLIRELTACATTLPDDLAEIYLAAFAITDPAPFLNERLSNLTGLHDRSSRTLVRRLANADELIAEGLAHRQHLRRGEASLLARGWTFTEFEGWVRLDLAQPEFRSRRRIRVVADELHEIKDLFMLPPGAGLADPVIEVPVGGTLTRTQRVSDSIWELGITPPRPLRRDDEHELEVIVRVAGPHGVLPYAVLSAVRPCRHFRIRVDVGDSGATDFFELSGIPAVALSDPFSGGVPVPIEHGRVEREFLDPTPGLAYGLRWRLPA